ncbi:MAG: serine/threonine-protein kinase [Phycisphaerales bacterium]|nr:serine/threonine-protein kinase [Phycisphaerales bacterium]
MSQDPRFQRVKEIFLAAVAAPDADRHGVVSAAAADDPDLAADVLALLAHHSTPSALLREAPASALEVKPEANGLPVPLGRFVLQRLLGEGATGRVFAGMQQNPRRPVAVKLLRPGLQSHARTIERFLREAEVLAKLDHPGIARVFESGVATLAWGPQAFIAMELIEGLPLAEYAARHNLSVPAKLELLAKVCDAVEYSHSHGVIHRDLKPSNVLVQPDGQPRVLDFGVAHAMYDETGTQPTLGRDLVGTLAYMSPEYAEGNDPGGAHSDVYSLGVIAYELISGFRPVVTDGTRLWEAMRAIREHRFPSLRERAPSCGVDLDMVVDKALRVEASDRYQSAGEFAADLRCIVENRPVSVHPPTLGYRLGKFLRRTRKASVVSAAVIALLLAGGVMSVRQWMVAQSRLREMELTLGFEKMLPRHRPGVTSADTTAQALSTVSSLATTELKEHPTVEATVQYRIGMEYIGSLGRFAEAERSMRRAIELSKRKDLKDPLVRELTRDWAALAAWRDNSFTSEEPLRKLVEEVARRGDDPAELYLARRQLAWMLSSRGLSDGLTAELNELEKLGAGLGEKYQRTKRFELSCIRASATFYSGNAQEAERLMPPLDEIREGIDRTPWRVAYRGAAHLAASVQLALGRVETAQDLLERLLLAIESELGPKSFEAVAIRSRLAGLLWLRGEKAAAERAFAELAEMTGPEGLDDPVLRGNALNSRGACLRDLGRLEEAESTLLEALAIRLQTGGPDSLVVSDTRMNLASLHLRRGRASEALSCAQDAERIRRLRSQWTPPKESETRAMIGRAKMMMDGPAAGLEDLQRAWQVRFDGGLVTNWQTNIAVDGVLEALLALGRIEEAERITRLEHSKLVEVAGPENLATKLAEERLAKVVLRVAKKSD